MDNLNNKQNLGLIGSLLIFIGVFTPILSMPIIGSLSFFQSGKLVGSIMLILAVASFALTLKSKFKELWITAAAIIAIIVYKFIRVLVALSETSTEMENELADNPFRGLAESMLESMSIQWGWLLLAIGAALIICCAMLNNKLQANTLAQKDDH